MKIFSVPQKAVELNAKAIYNNQYSPNNLNKAQTLFVASMPLEGPSYEPSSLTL
jgi:hypothetical protein